MPPRTLVSPERPDPVDSYGYVGIALIELVIRAMAKAMPDRIPAGGYQMFGVGFYRVDPASGPPFQFIDLHDGGAGGRPEHDGPVLIFAGDGDTPATPVEVIETRYPLRVERHELLPEMGGAGRRRGGAGVARDFRVLQDGVYLQFGLDNGDDPLAKGLDGGADGLPGLMVAHPGTDREEVVRRKLDRWGPLAEGDLISARSGGGGGLGDPREREPWRVAQDLRDGYVTEDEAREVYGVEIHEDGTVDRPPDSPG
jgi:N-methylhydantoinase B